MSRLVLALALATPLTAAAADAPKVEIFGGYSHARHESKETDGFLAALDVSLGHSLGIELSLSGHYRSEGGESLSWTTLLAGPRYAWRGERFTPFVHVLAGVVRSSRGLEVFDVDIRETDTDFGAAAGVGLDIGIGRRWAVRLDGEYTVHTGTEESRDGSVRHTEWDPRVSIGIVFRAGQR